MPFDIEYFLIYVFGKIINQIKTSENSVKSILLSNFPFSQKRMFLGRKIPRNSFLGDLICFWEHFWEDIPPFWEKGIAKYQEVLLCVRKVTREGVKRRI